MREIFKKTTNSIIASSVVACIVGLIMIVMPNVSIKTIGLIASLYIILHGIVLVVWDIKLSKYYIPFDGMLPGILSIVLGVILIGKPDIISVVFTLAIGVWIAISSINSIKMALALRNENVPWVLLLLFGLIDLILGIIVVFNPFEASISLTVFIGIMIIVHSVIDIIDMIIIKRDVKKFSDAITKRLKEL